MNAEATEVSRLIALLDKVAIDGPSSLPDNRNHSINRDPKIIQLTAGMARAAYFFDVGRLIIVCHGYHKGRTKIKEVVRVAVKARAAYFDAKRDGQIEYDEGE